MRLLDAPAVIEGPLVALGPFANHGDAIAALSDARRAEQTARDLVREVLALNPTSGELGEGMARQLQALATRYEKLTK